MATQLPDGGWNCEVENGATVSSVETTVNVLEGLLERERATGGSAEAVTARRRGEEYLVERRLFRRKSTGEEDGEGTPSRWNTLRAMRVLGWFAQGG